MKKNKASIHIWVIVGLVLFVIIAVAYYIFDLRFDGISSSVGNRELSNNEEGVIILEEDSSSEREYPPSTFNPSDRAEEFYVQSKSESYPRITNEFGIDPFEARIGDTVRFSVWAVDKAEVSTVSGLVHTDFGTEPVSFALQDGDTKVGRWEATWKVAGVGNEESYQILIIATNSQREQDQLDGFWHYQQ